MYQKLTDGYTNIYSEKQKEEELEKIKRIKDQPMSYIICPKCNNPNLETCSCSGGFLNYYCSMCRFQHVNHHHKPSDNISKNTKSVDRGTLAKIIKK